MANASSARSTSAGPSSVLSSPPSSSSPFGAMRSTFAQFRSQLSLSPLAQPDQLESANSGQGSPAGRGVGPAIGGGAQPSTNSGGGGGGDGGRGGGATGSATSDGGSTSRDSSLYDMADRLSAWPSEKIEKVKRLRDQFLSKA
jgi:hypothetical protein